MCLSRLIKAPLFCRLNGKLTGKLLHVKRLQLLNPVAACTELVLRLVGLRTASPDEPSPCCEQETLVHGCFAGNCVQKLKQIPEAAFAGWELWS